MNIRLKNHNGMSVIRIDGAFLSEPDQQTFRKRIRGLVDAGRTHLVIDLSHIRYINSCGLGALVCALTTVRKTGGDLVLVGVASDVKEILKVTRLETVFHVYSTAAEALSGLHVHEN